MKNSKPAILLLALTLFAGLAPAQSVEIPAENDSRAEALNKGAVKKWRNLPAIRT